jgi:hypothetical protein
LFVETWVESAWAEHLRYHERVSVSHKEVEQRVHRLVRPGGRIATRHLIAPTGRPPSAAALEGIIRTSIR